MIAATAMFLGKKKIKKILSKDWYQTCLIHFVRTSFSTDNKGTYQTLIYKK